MADDITFSQKVLATGDSLRVAGARWGYDATFERQTGPITDTVDPQFEYKDWVADHVDTQLFHGMTHGNPVFVNVEIYETEAASIARYNSLTPTERAGLSLTIIGRQIPPSHQIVGHYYGLGLTQSGLYYKMGSNRMADNAIAILGWCESTPFDLYYTQLGAGAVFSYPGCTEAYWHSTDPLKEFTKMQASLLGSLSCRYYPNYNSTVGSVERLLERRQSFMRLSSAIDPSLSMKQGTTCSGKPGGDAIDCDCETPLARFESCGWDGSAVWWSVKEFRTRGYYVLGFNEKGKSPASIEFVPTSREVTMWQHADYQFVPDKPMAFFEIVEVDDRSSSAHTYSGYLPTHLVQEPPSDFRAGTVVRSDVELYPAWDSQNAEPIRFWDDKTERWTEVPSEFDIPSGLSPTLLPLDTDPEEDCGWGTPTQEPDTVQCADWLVVSTRDSLSQRSRERQIEYMPGRTVSASIGVNGGPDQVRTAVRIVLCKNLKWNLWAEAHSIQRRFREKPLLTLVGSPGVSYGDSIGAIVLRYDQEVGIDSLCGGPCLNDGKMACALLSSPDSIVVPYTRVPAENINEVDLAYDTAIQYSSRTNVDSQRRVARLSGDFYDLSCAPGGVQAYPVPASTWFFEDVEPWFSYSLYPIVSQADPDCESSALDYINQGVELCIALGCRSSKARWPSYSLPGVSQFTTRQNVLAIVPSCESGLVIRENETPGSGNQPYAIKWLFNDSLSTRSSFTTSFSSPIYYSEGEEWLRRLLLEIDGESETRVFQDIIYDAQLKMVERGTRWDFVYRVSNVGAPVWFSPGITVSVKEDGVGEHKWNLKFWPSPVNGEGAAGMSFQLEQAGLARIDVFDLGGRLVGTILDERREAGINSVNWDLRQANGHRVVPGMYFARLKSGTQVLTTKVVVLR